jgi:hypothetical protein
VFHLSQEKPLSDTSVTARDRPTFLQFLGRHNNGETSEALRDALQDVVATLEQLNQDHGIRASKGQLKITIDVKRKNDVYEVTVNHEVKKPKAPAGTDIMWATGANGLVPENPRQQKFPFTEVVKPIRQPVDHGQPIVD